MKRWIIMDHNNLKKAPYDSISDLSNAKEYKDRPITFTLHEARGRQEEIKIVEPELDFPLPENDRLVVAEKDHCLTDVVFKFNPASGRPYELHFKALSGITYDTDHLMVFGIRLEDDENLLSEYEMKIVDRGRVQAWIKMTQGKARLIIKYRGAIQ
jgi:hypothetical protein